MCGSFFFFFSSRRRHTRCSRDWSSDVCSSDLLRRRIVERPAVILIDDSVRPIQAARPAARGAGGAGDGVLHGRLIHIAPLDRLSPGGVLLLENGEPVDLAARAGAPNEPSHAPPA